MNIALSPISFHQKLFTKHMSQADVPAAALELGFEAVEFLDLLAVPLPAGRWTALARRVWQSLQRRIPMLPRNPLPARPKSYQSDIAYPLRAAADAAGIRIISWTVDTDLTAQGEALTEQRAYWLRGIAAARILGAKVLRVTTGGQDGDANMLPTATENLRELVALAEGLQVAVENNWGLSSNPNLLTALLEAVPGAGCCLDFGNFDSRIRNEAVLALIPHAVHIHAKSKTFDANGEERTLPYKRFMHALSEVKYEGWFVIEYEGYDDPVVGIEQTRALLTRYGARKGASMRQNAKT